MGSLIGGIVATAIGVVLLILWIKDFVTVIKGGIPICLICGGILAIIIGISTIKEKIAEKAAAKEESKESKPEEAK